MVKELWKTVREQVVQAFQSCLFFLACLLLMPVNTGYRSSAGTTVKSTPMYVATYYAIVTHQQGQIQDSVRGVLNIWHAFVPENVCLTTPILRARHTLLHTWTYD